jgi:hypothetical protein
MDFSSPTGNLHTATTELWKTFATPGSREVRRRDDAQIDPGMIFHPSKSSIGAEPPGTLIAQNLYPGLRLLPIEDSRAALQASPAQWPNLKMQQVPTLWPKCKLLPVKGDSAKP